MEPSKSVPIVQAPSRSSKPSSGTVLRGAALLTLALLVTLALVRDASAQGIHVTLRSQTDPYDGYQQYAGVWGDGHYAYIGSERRNGVLIYDITNPDLPVLASYYNPSNSLDMEDIKVANGIAFFADNMGSGLHIVDVSNPASPTLLSQITSANGGYDNTHKVAIWQNFVFIPQNLTAPAIIKVFDVSNPSSPVLKTTFTATDPKWVNDIDIQTNTAGQTLLYTAGWGGKGDIWDITNIATAAPTLLGSFSAGADGSSASATADGNYLAYTTKNPNGTSFVTLYNVSNPASVTVASTLTMTALGIDAVTPHDPKIMGNLLYVSWFQAGTLIFDITNPAAPVFVGSYDTWPGPVLSQQLDGNWGVYPYLGQDRVLISDRNTGLYIVDATGVTSAPALYNLHVNPSVVLAGGSSTGTVYLVGVAGSSGTVITTTSDNPAAVTPANVTVPNGGASANFTITTSAVNSTTTATITASYAGASDTAALSIAPVADFQVNAAPPSLTISPNQPGTISGTLTAIATYNSSVTLSCTGSPPPTCTPSPVTLTPTAAGAPFTLTVASSTTGNYNFNLHAVGSDSTTHDFPLTVSVSTAADFTITPTTNTQTVTAGQTATYPLTIASVNGSFTNAVSLTCSGAPAGSTCTVSPNSVTPGSSGASATVTVTTTARRAALLRPSGFVYALWLPFMGIVFIGRNPSKLGLRSTLGLATVMILLLWLPACGGGGASNPPPPPPPTGTTPGTYMLTVTGTSGALSHSMTLTLTVQ